MHTYVQEMCGSRKCADKQLFLSPSGPPDKPPMPSTVSQVKIKHASIINFVEIYFDFLLSFLFAFVVLKLSYMLNLVIKK